MAPVTLALTAEPGTLVLQLISPARAHYLNNLSLMITNLLTELYIPVGPNRQNNDLQKTWQHRHFKIEIKIKMAALALDAFLFLLPPPFLLHLDPF